MWYLVLLGAVSLQVSGEEGAAGGRHAFYRSLGGGGSAGGGRRVFGGAAAALREYGAVCALLDRYWAVRCSAAVLAPHWAVTAAHCVSRRLAYVKYNTRRPASTDGDVAAVLWLYRHPKYEVRQTDEGRGPDVTLLHNDVGLVRTRTAMRLASAPPQPPLASLSLHDANHLTNKPVKVLGFGRTERSALGEELFAVELRLVGCERAGWHECACAVAAAGEARGVCSGDSGGPLLHAGALLAVTSMGPVECAEGRGPPPGATSVFTTLRPYAALLNATLTDADAALRMSVISAATAHTSPLLAHLLVLLKTLLVTKFNKAIIIHFM